MLFIDSEVSSTVSFIWYSWYNAGAEREILDTLIFDGCILLYSDKGKRELVMRSSAFGWRFRELFDVSFLFPWKWFKVY